METMRDTVLYYSIPLGFSLVIVFLVCQLVDEGNVLWVSIRFLTIL